MSHYVCAGLLDIIVYIGKKKAGLKDRQRQEFDSEEHNPVRRVEEVSN